VNYPLTHKGFTVRERAPTCRRPPASPSIRGERGPDHGLRWVRRCGAPSLSPFPCASGAGTAASASSLVASTRPPLCSSGSGRTPTRTTATSSCLRARPRRLHRPDGVTGSYTARGRPSRPPRTRARQRTTSRAPSSQPDGRTGYHGAVPDFESELADAGSAQRRGSSALRAPAKCGGGQADRRGRVNLRRTQRDRGRRRVLRDHRLHHAREWPTGEVHGASRTNLVLELRDPSECGAPRPGSRGDRPSTNGPTGACSSAERRPSGAKLVTTSARVQTTTALRAAWAAAGPSGVPTEPPTRGSRSFSEPASCRVHELSQRRDTRVNVQSVHNIASL
jgi:hypothetical protein